MNTMVVEAARRSGAIEGKPGEEQQLHDVPPRQIA